MAGVISIEQGMSVCLMYLYSEPFQHPWYHARHLIRTSSDLISVIPILQRPREGS